MPYQWGPGAGAARAAAAAARPRCAAAAWAAALASAAVSWGPRVCLVQQAPMAAGRARATARGDWGGQTLRLAGGREASARRVARWQAARQGAEGPVPEELQRQLLPQNRHELFPVRIDNTWYNLASWRRKHPGGARFIEYYEGQDATEAMYTFHSHGARRFLEVLPRVSEAMAAELQRSAPPVSEVTWSFRKLRERLENEGWWERDLRQEAAWLCIWGSLFFGGLALARIPEWGASLAVLPLTLAAVQGAWLGHDYTHGVDAFSKGMRLFAPLAIGISPTWWSDKHNKHHALTNQMGADVDISMPPLYLWTPHPEDDCPLRHTQHYWFFLGCMTVFFSWRLRSIAGAAAAAQQRRPGAREELAALAAHWALLLACVPLPAVCAFIALAGLICGTILTTSHLNEQFYEDFQHDWVTAQFRSTRDAITRNAFTEWLWGGMQYHLEHHLFPSMPRSRYPQLVPVLRAFAEEHGIPGGYRADDEAEMLKRTWEHLRRIAKEPGGDTSAPRLYDDSRPTGIGYQSRRPAAQR